MICTYAGCGALARETVLSEQRRLGGIISWIPKHFCPAHAENARRWSRQPPAEAKPAAPISDVPPSTKLPRFRCWIDLSQPVESQ